MGSYQSSPLGRDIQNIYILVYLVTDILMENLTYHILYGLFSDIFTGHI